VLVSLRGATLHPVLGFSRIRVIIVGFAVDGGALEGVELLECCRGRRA
jgi:hypothetical protein